MARRNRVTMVLAAGLLVALSGGTQAGLDTRVYYSFDGVVDADGSGGYTFNSTDYFADLSGNGHNALLRKESTVTADDPIGTIAMFGSSFRVAGRLNGQNNHTYTSTPHAADLDFTGNDDFTFSLWTYSHYDETWGHRGYYFTKQLDPDTPDWDLGGDSQGYAFARRGGGGAVDHRWSVNDGTGLEFFNLPADSGDRWDNEKWALWTITFDGDAASDNLNAYVNGQLVMTRTVTSTNWSNAEPLVIAGRMGEHQRSFVWPASASGDGYIDDFVALGDTLTAEEILSILELGTHPDLGYAFGDVEQLLSLHRDGVGSVSIGDLVWSFARGMDGEPGLSGSGTDFELVLTLNGTGLIGSVPQVEPIIPEPATLSLLGVGLLAVARRRKR